MLYETQPDRRKGQSLSPLQRARVGPLLKEKKTLRIRTIRIDLEWFSMKTVIALISLKWARVKTECVQKGTYTWQVLK